MTATTPPANPIPRPKRRRRLWVALGVAAGLLTVAVVALPALLSTAPARARIVGRINQVLAPGFLQVGELELHWWGTTRLRRVTLLDPRGQVVVATPTASLDRGLWHLLAGGLTGATLTLDHPDLDIERSADGTVNLGQALSSLFAHPDPHRDLTIRIPQGTLRFRDPGLVEPVVADHVDLTLRMPPAPNPIAGTLRLGQDDRSLEVAGSLDRWNQRGRSDKPAEIRLDVRGERWPWTVRAGGVDAAGQFDGTVDVARRRGLWRLSGDARLLEVAARGEPLRGDVLALDRVAAGWDLDQGADGWAIRRLTVAGDFGDLRADGSLAATGKRRIEGKLDLAAIARQIPHALRLRDGLAVERGSARLEIVATPATQGTTWDAEAHLSDLVARDGSQTLTLRDPATLSARLLSRSDGGTPNGEIRVDRVSVKTPFLDASIRPADRVPDGYILDGTLDLAGIRRQLGDWFDFGRFDVAGRATLAGRYQPEGRNHEAGLKAEIRELRIDGLTAEPIRREAATVEITAKSPNESVWPVTQARLVLTSAETTATLGFAATDQERTLDAHVSLPVAAGDAPSKLNADLAGRWQADRRVDLDSLVLDLIRADGSHPLTVAATGRYDHDAGTLALGPMPDPPQSSPVRLAPEGVLISGIGRGLADLHASAQFVGELSTPDRPWSGLLRVDGDGDGAQIAAKVGLDGPKATEGRPTAATLRARYDRGADRLDVAEMTLTSLFGAIDASGRVDDLDGRRQLDLNGTVAPDFAAITAWLSAHVEPGAKVSGKPQPFRVAGSLGRDGLADLDGEAGVQLDELDVYGLRLGSTPIRARAKDGSIRFEPISTSLNEGHIRLEPEIGRDAEGRPSLRLGKNSTIRDARINDEVSRRVLLYVAPILEDATTVTGRVSVDLDHAEIPLTPGRSETTRVEGAVVFTEVEFAPGVLANQVLQAIGRRDARLRIDQPVTLTIADGRVNQRGLSIPVGELTKVDLEGWVAFDRRLNLTASVPVTPAMLGDNALLADIAAGTRVALPIGGTLDRPEIDREALATHMKELGKSVLTRGATRGAIEILRRLAQPRDPNAPPPEPRLTPQERRARRQEKRAERRGETPP